jgi:pimeloyl-ACP methyl ester carboxylesterase
MLFTDSITYTPERQGQVPWVYIKCSQDRVNPPSQQKYFVENFGPFAEVAEMDTCHLSFLQKPDEFSHLVLRLVDKHFKAH